jgi:phosphoglycerol transferase MdoB-like AlkP superfamily enzyme
MAYRPWLFNVAAGLSLVIAAYHVTGIFYPINSSPPWRHFIFACICLFCFYGFIKRPVYFTYFFFVLLIQQVYSHGSFLLSQWHDYNKVDWISLLLLIFLPVLFFNLLLDLRSKH